jgi:hypothetical protein
MTQKTVLHATWGFVGATLLGLFLVGMAFALVGAWDAWDYPQLLEDRSGEKVQKVRTVLGYAARIFCGGAIIGGLGGMIAGAGIAVKRLWSRDEKTD